MQSQYVLKIAFLFGTTVKESVCALLMTCGKEWAGLYVQKGR